MAKKSQSFSTSEFSKKTGISVSIISKLIRDGKIKGKKESGKWMIAESQLKAKAVQELLKAGKPAPAAGKAARSKKTAAKAKKAPTPAKKAEPKKAPKPSGKSLSIAEFSKLTYLTEFGVENFLQMGRLTGSRGEDGNWRIDAANLEAPGIKQLVR
jgi:ribosomal protein L12E/L44/L45/RPP1/RPP2